MSGRNRFPPKFKVRLSTFMIIFKANLKATSGRVRKVGMNKICITKGNISLVLFLPEIVRCVNGALITVQIDPSKAYKKNSLCLRSPSRILVTRKQYFVANLDWKFHINLTLQTTTIAFSSEIITGTIQKIRKTLKYF